MLVQLLVQLLVLVLVLVLGAGISSARLGASVLLLLSQCDPLLEELLLLLLH